MTIIIISQSKSDFINMQVQGHHPHQWGPFPGNRLAARIADLTPDLQGVRLLTGMDRNAPEWTSTTGMDLKIHPKIHVLSVFDMKFWLSNTNYQKSSVSRQFQCKKCFLKYFLSYPDILVPY